MYDRDKLRLNLSQKITSAEQLIQAITSAIVEHDGYSVEDNLNRIKRYLPSKQRKTHEGVETEVLAGSFTLDFMYATRATVIDSDVYRMYTESFNNYAVPVARWWIVREALRFATKLRTPLREFSSLEHYCDSFESVFAYQSETDPTRLAYTPTIEDGEADRQRIVTIPRLMRSMPGYWHKADPEMAQVADNVRAELTAELELLYGADIAQAYEKGPLSCMSENRSGGSMFNIRELGVHPTAAYDYPGWACAVVRSGDGFSQRAMVWVNPDNPDDKRIIRVYGSGPLMRLLNRNGFKVGTSNGTRLKRIVAVRPAANPGRTVFVVPYIDSNGGMNHGNYVVDRGDYIEVVSEQTAARWMNAKAYTSVRAASTNGWVEIATLDPIQHVWNCAGTGRTISRLDENGDPHPVILLKDGVPVEAEVCQEFYSRMGQRRSARTQGKRREVVSRTVADDVPVFISDDDGCRWVDTEANRKFNGYVPMDPAQYPDATGLVYPRGSDTLCFAWSGFTKPESHAWLLADCATVIELREGVPAYRLALLSSIDRDQYTRIRSVPSAPDTLVTLKHRDVLHIEMTRNGKTQKSVPGVHDDIVKLVDGSYADVRETVMLSMPAGDDIHVKRSWLNTSGELTEMMPCVAERLMLWGDASIEGAMREVRRADGLADVPVTPGLLRLSLLRAFKVRISTYATAAAVFSERRIGVWPNNWAQALPEVEAYDFTAAPVHAGYLPRGIYQRMFEGLMLSYRTRIAALAAAAQPAQEADPAPEPVAAPAPETSLVSVPDAVTAESIPSIFTLAA